MTPLKVGDRVRVTEGSQVFGYQPGNGGIVTAGPNPTRGGGMHYVVAMDKDIGIDAETETVFDADVIETINGAALRQAGPVRKKGKGEDQSMIDFTRREGETAQAWSERLKGLPASGLNDAEVGRWMKSLGAAKDALTRGLHGATADSALERAKRDIQELSDEERRQIVLWMADSMPDD